MKELEGKRDLESDRDKGRFLHPDFAGRKLAGIASIEIERALDRGVREREWSAATRNRHRSFLTAIWNHAGITFPKVARLREPAGRVRMLERDEAVRLLAELPLHLRRPAAFALLTGLRQSNVTGLRWSRVDLGRRIVHVEARDAKAGKAIHVPLSDDAVRLLIEARDCPEYGHGVYVFTYAKPRPHRAPESWRPQHHPILQPDGAAWKKALVRAGIKDFRWHDLRHTWASWHVMAGTPLAVLQELGGWHSVTMVQRYAHLSQQFTASYARNATLPTGSRGEPLLAQAA